MSGIVSALLPAASVEIQSRTLSGARSDPYVSDHEDEAKKIDEATELIELGVLYSVAEIEIDDSPGRKYEG